MSKIKKILQGKIVGGYLKKYWLFTAVISSMIYVVDLRSSNQQLLNQQSIDRASYQLALKEKELQSQYDLAQLKDSIKTIRHQEDIKRYQEVSEELMSTKQDLEREKAKRWELQKQSNQDRRIDELAQQIIAYEDITEPNIYQHFPAYAEKVKQYSELQSLVDLLEVRVMQARQYERWRAFIEKRRPKERGITMITSSVGN